MSGRTRRRRAVLLLSLALACGGLAASEVGGRVREVEGRVGAPVPVVVATRDLPAGKPIPARGLAERRVPTRYAPPDALASPAAAVGGSPRAPIRRGGYLTASALASPHASGGDPGGLRRGERAVEVSVAGGSPLAEAGGAGSRVDVVVSTEPRSGTGRTFLALENVELLALDGPSGTAGAGASGGERSTGDADGASGHATATATLRVTLRQAVYLSAAQNFAREVRLLPRPPGDRGRAGRAAVAADGL